MPDRTGMKRSRSRSPPPWSHPQKSARQSDGNASRKPRRNGNGNGNGNNSRDMKEQTRLNQLQEAEQMREWVAQEDNFVLKQAKRKAEIRVKEGRPKPIDWLTVTLRVIDPTRDPMDDEIADSDLDLIHPDGVFEGLSQAEMLELEKDIETFLKLETNSKNQDFWRVG